jgi:RNA 2',3'-cyclic 3'-phosphodiesterase
MRLFVGIPLEGQLHQEVASLLAPLARRFPPARWVKPENLHLTLRFLGEVPEPSLAEVAAWFDTNLAGAPFGALALEPVPGWFQHRDRVVFWFGLASADWIIQTAERLSGIVAGAPPEARAFVPHLTVGRYRMDRRRKPELDDFLSYFRQLRVPATIQPAARVVLYESTLHPTGATYREVMTSPL